MPWRRGRSLVVETSILATCVGKQCDSCDDAMPTRSRSGASVHPRAAGREELGPFELHGASWLEVDAAFADVLVLQLCGQRHVEVVRCDQELVLALRAKPSLLKASPKGEGFPPRGEH
jgi:hypothetical protein